MMLAWLNVHAGPNELAYDAGMALAIIAHASLIHFLCDGFRLASGEGPQGNLRSFVGSNPLSNFC
jgi:hypothetical protein